MFFNSIEFVLAFGLRLLYELDSALESFCPIFSLHFDWKLPDLASNRYAYFDGTVPIIKVDHVRLVNVDEEMRNIVENGLQESW